MNSTIIEKQIGILQKILGECAEKGKNGSENFPLFVKNYFGFDSDFGWNILMNAFYVFEDTELAKGDFEKFGIQGPSRHENTGEKYLRLYGVLNAIYQQCLALINLMELFKLSQKGLLSGRLRKSECIVLRNKIAAHSTNYSEERGSKSFDVYEISRHNLESGIIFLVKNQTDFEKFDLEKIDKRF